MLNKFKKNWALILIVITLPLMAFSLDGLFSCNSCDSDLDLVQSDDTTTTSGIVFDPDAPVYLPDNVNQVFPTDVSFTGQLPNNLVASNSEVSVPSPSNPDQVVSLASWFKPFDQDSFKNDIGQKFNKLLNKMTDSIGSFAEDILSRVRDNFSDLKANEGDFLNIDIPYIENNLNFKTIVKLERPGDGTYEITVGLGHIVVADYALDLNLFKMKWQPNASFKFKGYVILNTKLINYVLQAAWGFKLPFDYARFDFNFTTSDPSIEVWLHGLSDLPEEIPELLKFKYARLGMEKMGIGFRVRSTFEGLVQPTWFDKIGDLTGLSMSDPKLKLVAYAQVGGDGGLAVKFEDYGIAGKAPITHEDLLLDVDCGARVYFNSSSGSMGIELEIANPRVKYGDWETSFGSVLTWITDQLLGVNNWLSSGIEALTTQKITEVNFYSTARATDPDFWEPFLVEY